MATVQEAAGAAPVALAEALAFLRIESEAEEGLIAGLVRSATSHCEAFLGQVLIERSVEETVPASSEWRRLSLTPVRSIEPIEGLAVDAYAIDIDHRGDGWVRVPRGPGPARVTVRYSAGMAAEWNGVPEPVRQGILRLVAHLFRHRDSAVDAGPPAAVAALWRPWRRMRLL